MEDHFNGIVGQRYKLHHGKGHDSGNMEGKDPNRFVLSGVYAGSTTLVNPVGVPILHHIFNNCIWPSGMDGVPTKILRDSDFASRRYYGVKQASGGRRKRTRQQRRHKRRLTRRRRA